MSTVELASPQPMKPSAGLVPAPPIPARSRLRGTPSSLNLAGSGTATREASANTTPTPRTPAPQLPSSPSDSSIRSTSSGSASASLPGVSSPGVPITPRTPPAHERKQSSGWKFGSVGKASRSGGHDRMDSGLYLPDVTGQIAFGDKMPGTPGSSEWPGKLDGSQSPASASQKRSRFSRASRHSSSGSVSLSASSDPFRVKDGVAPRGSSSGVYTPPTYPGPSPRPSYSHQSSYASSTTLSYPASRSASGSSDMSTAYSTSGSSSISYPQTPTSPYSPSAAAASASKMYNACVGALSGWSISSASSKRASHEPRPLAPYSPVHVDAGPMSANAAYFSAPPVHKPTHQTTRSVSYSQNYGQDQGPVQIWSPSEGWTENGRAAGLGVGVEEEGNYVQGRPRGNSVATQMILVGDAPKGRRKPVPQAQEEVHAL